MGTNKTGQDMGREAIKIYVTTEKQTKGQGPKLVKYIAEKFSLPLPVIVPLLAGEEQVPKRKQDRELFLRNCTIANIESNSIVSGIVPTERATGYSVLKNLIGQRVSGVYPVYELTYYARQSPADVVILSRIIAIVYRNIGIKGKFNPNVSFAWE